MAKSVELPSIQFKTQASAAEFFKEMLYRYRPGDIVSETDSRYLSELFERHLEYEEKKGVGIDHFEVMRGDFSSQCFGIVRVDGTEENFSAKRCITRQAR